MSSVWSLLSVDVGLPREVRWRGRSVRTGIGKHPVEGPATVRRLNLDGDGQADLVGHGGEHRAVLVHQRRQLGRASPVASAPVSLVAPSLDGEPFSSVPVAQGSRPSRHRSHEEARRDRCR